MAYFLQGVKIIYEILQLTVTEAEEHTQGTKGGTKQLTQILIYFFASILDFGAKNGPY